MANVAVVFPTMETRIKKETNGVVSFTLTPLPEFPENVKSPMTRQGANGAGYLYEGVIDASNWKTVSSLAIS